MVLKRGPGIQDFEDEHIAWLYAAHRKGAFRDIVGFEDDMSPEVFETKFLESVLNFDVAWILTAPNQKGPETPVGFMAAFVRGQVMEPHVDWFPWATSRNKLETMLHFFNTFRHQFWIMAFVEMKDRPFFDKLKDYGVLWRVGPIFDSPMTQGKPAMMYHSQKGRDGKMRV